MPNGMELLETNMDFFASAVDVLQKLVTLIKAALGNTEEYDKLLDEMFYDYNDNHR